MIPTQDHLWLLTCSDDEPAADILSKLSVEEQARCARFYFARDRNLYATGHAVLRQGLACLAGTVASDLQFSNNPYGKPELQPPRADLHFNISHSQGLVAVLIAAAPCGVDVEAQRSMDDLIGMAGLVFHPQEQSWVVSDPTLSLKRFFGLWVLKEAYLKGRGEGFGGSPQAVCFACPLTETPQLTVAPDADRWQFDHWHESSGHAVALARQTRRPLQIWRAWPGSPG